MQKVLEQRPRGRILIAAAAAIALAGIIAVIAVASSGGDEGRELVAAPPRCLRSWNADQAALAYGRHNFSFHLYEGALVTFLDSGGEEVDAGEGLCAVIFPSQVLDPEPFAAGQVLQGRNWVAISSLDGVSLARLAELQAIAAGAPNTTLDVQGVLVPL